MSIFDLFSSSPTKSSIWKDEPLHNKITKLKHPKARIRRSSIIYLTKYYEILRKMCDDKLSGIEQKARGPFGAVPFAMAKLLVERLHEVENTFYLPLLECTKDKDPEIRMLSSTLLKNFVKR